MGLETWFTVQRIRETGRGRGASREDKGDSRGRARGGRERVWEGQFTPSQGVREGPGRRKPSKLCPFLSPERSLCEPLAGTIISGTWQCPSSDLIQESSRRSALSLPVNTGRGHSTHAAVGRGWRKQPCYLQRGSHAPIPTLGTPFRPLASGRMMSPSSKESSVVGDITVLKSAQCCLTFVLGPWRGVAVGRGCAAHRLPRRGPAAGAVRDPRPSAYFSSITRRRAQVPWLKNVCYTRTDVPLTSAAGPPEAFFCVGRCGFATPWLQ